MPGTCQLPKKVELLPVVQDKTAVSLDVRAYMVPNSMKLAEMPEQRAGLSDQAPLGTAVPHYPAAHGDA